MGGAGRSEKNGAGRSEKDGAGAGRSEKDGAGRSEKGGAGRSEGGAGRSEDGADRSEDGADRSEDPAGSSIGGSTGISRGFNGLQNGSTPPQDGTGSQDGARSQDDPAPHLDGVPPTDPKKAQSCWSCCGCWNWFRSSGPSIHVGQTIKFDVDSQEYVAEIIKVYPNQEFNCRVKYISPDEKPEDLKLNEKNMTFKGGDGHSGKFEWYSNPGPGFIKRCVAWITYPWSKVKELCTCCTRRTTPTPPESQGGDDDKQLDSAQQRADLIAGRSFGLYVPQVMPDTHPGDWEKLGCFGKAVVTFMLVTFFAVFCIANFYMSCRCLFCCC